MKTLVKVIVATLLLTVSVFGSYAKKDDKIALKSRQIVENATPDDWKALAEAAAICVKKKTNLTQAAEWLDKSLSIKTTAYNLEIKGDYMLLSNLPQEAMSFYIKAMQTGLSTESNFDVTALQSKIAKLKNTKN